MAGTLRLLLDRCRAREQVTGESWPSVAVRQDMLEEAMLIIRALLTGELTTWEGAHFRVDSARLWVIPTNGVPIAVAVSGERSVERFGGGWSVNSDLPTPAGFEGASRFVRPEDVASSIPCGPDLDAIADAVRPFWEAGFTDIALVQVGDENQELVLREAAPGLLAKLRAAASDRG